MPRFEVGPERFGDVSLSIGDTLVVRLRENPGTGYRWAPIDSPRCLSLVDDDIALPTAAKPGQSGVRVLTYTAVRAGEERVEFGLARAWEDLAARTVTLMVRVGEG